MKKSRLIITLFLTMSLPTAILANPFGDMMATMLRMMLIMADTMSGNTNNQQAGSFSMGQSFGSSMMPGMGYSPWNNAYPGAYGQPWPAPGMPNHSSPWANAASNPYQPDSNGASMLNGQWYGQSGEVFEVQGQYFRMQKNQQTITGTIQFSGNVVQLNPSSGKPMFYRFIQDRSRLMFQDPNGRILRFQKNAGYPQNNFSRSPATESYWSTPLQPQTAPVPRPW